MIREIKREKKIDNYDAVRIKIASPEVIREWSYGEVTKPDTLNYRTLKPEKDGLFCERIFGPEKDYECSCGKYKKKRFRNTICDRCGVEVTTSRVRRSRMGHLELAVPVSHIWFVKSAPSKIGTLLDLSIKKLERIIYYESYIVLDPGESDYEKKDLIEAEYFLQIRDKVGDEFVAEMGSEAIRKLLEELDLEALSMDLRAQIKMETSALKKQNAIKKLKVVDAFRKSGNKPEWMILEALPVLPPTLRPLVPLEGGRFATADFNDLYRRVITRNNRLKQLSDINAPEVIMRNEKRMLQESVDALIDNARKTRPIKSRSNRALKSLTDQLKGKQGRFRQNLLGKRVDYSGRSVITVGPDLKIYQCGLPKDMAVELFRPFLIERLERTGEAEKTKTAKKMVDSKQPIIWKMLEEVIEDYPVMLNRAPTLHRLGIQAFLPVLTEDKAIKLHPMVCGPFNADFDGDQMGCYIPLSYEAQMEARVLMLSSRNLLLPANGKLAMSASQDIVLGCYYLTTSKYEEPTTDNIDELNKIPYFDDPNDIILLYEEEERIFSVKGDQNNKRKFDLHTWIRFRDHNKKWQLTTVGRVIFNQIVPREVDFQNYAMTKNNLNNLARVIFNSVGQFRTAQFLDDLKDIGFKYATRSGVTFSAWDVIIPKEKDKILAKTEAEVKEIFNKFLGGSITDTERYNRIVDKWKSATEEITEALMKELEKDQDGFNSIHLMADSGARGNKDQIKQLGGIRGLMDKPSKGGSTVQEVIDTPIKSSFKEGLDVLEYFISSHGARKGLADTALKTADAGYLTRRLVDVSQNSIIREIDCGTIEGLEVKALKEGNEIVESLSERIQGRTTIEDIMDPTLDDDDENKIIVPAGEIITNEKAELIEKHGVLSVRIRSVLTCECENGICVKCYGRNLATQKPVSIGEPVGIIAAQSIGEPGTQLTLRTFHIGGTASTDVDMAQVDSNFDGIVKLERVNAIVNRDNELVSISHLGSIKILNKEDINDVLEEYKVEYAAKIYVKDGDEVVKNSKLFSWDNYNNPLLATAEGMLKYDNFIKNVTYKEEFNELTGMPELSVIESKSTKLQPQFKIVTKLGEEHLIPVPTGLNIEVEDETYVYPGDTLGKSSRTTAKAGDITGGLPRVQDLFEARIPKNKAIVSDISGKVTIGELTKNGRLIYVTSDHGIEHKFTIPSGKRIIVYSNDFVDAGDPLSDGTLDPHDILKAKGVKAAQQLILDEVQEVYRKQGVKIDDKHIGVIIRQMMKKVSIVDPGHTLFLEGEVVDKSLVKKENQRIEKEGGMGATFEQLLLGITKASLKTESWLSAASFQETTKVLTQAAIEGRIDPLEGLKESIILGHRIPVGTGTKYYNKIILDLEESGKTVQEIVAEIGHSEEEENVDEILDF